MRARKPDTRRRCFRPCRRGKFCACKGRVIPGSNTLEDYMAEIDEGKPPLVPDPNDTGV